MSTLAAVEEILRETKVPMSVRQIVEQARGRLPTRSKTPDTVVARDLSMDIKKHGEASLFIRTSPGRYTLRELVQAMQAGDAGSSASPPQPASGAGSGPGADQAEPRSSEPEQCESEPTSVLASAMRGDRVGTLAARHPKPADSASRTITK